MNYHYDKFEELQKKKNTNYISNKNQQTTTNNNSHMQHSQTLKLSTYSETHKPLKPATATYTVNIPNIIIGSPIDLQTTFLQTPKCTHCVFCFSECKEVRKSTNGMHQFVRHGWYSRRETTNPKRREKFYRRVVGHVLS